MDRFISILQKRTTGLIFWALFLVSCYLFFGGDMQSKHFAIKDRLQFGRETHLIDVVKKFGGDTLVVRGSGQTYTDRKALESSLRKEYGKSGFYYFENGEFYYAVLDTHGENGPLYRTSILFFLIPASLLITRMLIKFSISSDKTTNRKGFSA